ncbi:MAG: Mth938-like domain-containing protein [Alphaproteobacteria bacterium]
MELNPLVPPGRQLIQAYGGHGFRIAGVSYEGSVLVFPDRTLSLRFDSVSELSEEHLAEVLAGATAVDILLVGCGVKIEPVASGLRTRLSEAGVVIEAMSTGAACRTFNVLLAEDRRAAAALIPVP